MAWIWDFWRREATTAEGSGRRSDFPASAVESVSSHDWGARLVEAGVSAEWADRLAERLEPIARELGPTAEQGLVRGVALAVAVQSEAASEIERSSRDVREVERLLGAFNGELEKLDEVLEVLAAYAQRMRSKPASVSTAADFKKSRRTLH